MGVWGVARRAVCAASGVRGVYDERHAACGGTPRAACQAAFLANCVHVELRAACAVSGERRSQRVACASEQRAWCAACIV